MAVMAHMLLFVLGFAALGQPAESTIAKVTPLQKVIDMLNSVTAKGKKEKQQEEVAFAAFQEWCNGLRDEKMRGIKTAEDAIVQLNADMDKAKSDAEVLASEIGDLEAVIAKNEDEAAKAKAVRAGEKKDYMAMHLDFSESIDALERAISVVRAKKADVPQSLLQVQNLKLVAAREKAVIEAFLALQSGDTDQVGAPEANAYENQSSGVVDMLVGLRRKFEDQLLSLQKEEMNAKHNFDMLLQQLTDDIKADKASVSDKTATKASRLEDAATAKGDLAVTEKGKAEDEEVLSDTLAECSVASKEFEQNQVTRSGEIQAIKKAVEILSSGAVSGNAEKHLPAASLLQAHKKATKLAQLRSVENDDPQVRRRVAEFLQGRAQKLGSRYLALVASHVAEDPFGKIKSMIKDLIVKLMEEANAEADQNAYCNTELATNKATRENKASEVEELAANIDQHSAESSQLASEIGELSDAIKELRGQQAGATSIRSEEKSTNAQTVADAKEAQGAVEEATSVLREFYDQAAGGPAMIQNAAGLAAEMASATKAPYKGNQDSSTGIFGMLEVVLSDFARLETETSVAEAQAQSGYEKFMNESNEDIAVKETEMTHKEAKRARVDEENRGLKKNMKLTQTELDKAMDYYDKLKADCVDTGLSYEDRVKGREEEIQSLKEALRILAGEDLA